MMSWSIGEIMALTVKAARGATMHWGIAEEAGFAVGWLHVRDYSGVNAIASLLEGSAADNGLFNAPSECAYFAAEVEQESQAAAKLFCPIALGASLMDFEFEKPLHRQTIGVVQTPLLLMPFLVNGLERQNLQDSVGIEVDGNILRATDIGRADTHTISVLNTLPINGHSSIALVATGQPQQAAMIDEHTGIEMTVPRVGPSFQRDVKRLQALAQLTYAPATDYSRLAGAGAGTTDND